MRGRGGSREVMTVALGSPHSAPPQLGPMEAWVGKGGRSPAPCFQAGALAHPTPGPPITAWPANVPGEGQRPLPTSSQLSAASCSLLCQKRKVRHGYSVMAVSGCTYFQDGVLFLCQGAPREDRHSPAQEQSEGCCPLPTSHWCPPPPSRAGGCCWACPGLMPSVNGVKGQEKQPHVGQDPRKGVSIPAYDHPC